MIKFLDLYSQYLSIQSDIDAAIASTIRDSAFVGGPALREFEEAFGRYQQASYCVGVANGTDAIEIALEALDLPARSEVIVPANSFIASSEAVTRTGHRVVFADADPRTYTLDVSDVARRITSRTGAVIAVHLYGHPCDLEGLFSLTRETGIRIIEDCAQAHGAEYRGRRVGAIGDIGTFSFYPGKNLGAYGDGGAITTNDEALATRCRMIANHGRIDKYDHRFEGRNSRLDGLQAAILNAKLKHLDSWVEKRNQIARSYIDGLAGLPDLLTPVTSPGVRHAFHLFVVRTPHRQALADFLRATGIQTGIHYPIALPKLAAYEYLGQANEPLRANALDAEVLSLPIGEHLNDADVRTVVEITRNFFGEQSARGFVPAREGEISSR
jgi:dTDP-4-amino-4,6-dideoxygalactose transaminase